MWNIVVALIGKVAVAVAPAIFSWIGNEALSLIAAHVSAENAKRASASEATEIAKGDGCGSESRNRRAIDASRTSSNIETGSVLMRAILIAAAALFLCGCASAPPSPPSIAAVCPPVKAYSKAEQDGLAAAVAVLPPSNPLIGAMLDYGRLRAAARACMLAAANPESRK